MPLTGKKGYAKETTDVGKKVVDVASGATPSGAVVRGGKAAARWALDKYRAYSKAKSKRDAEEAKKKADAEKAKNEARADELYGKGKEIKKPAEKKPEAKTMPTKKPSKSQLDRIKENQRRKRESLNY